MVSRVRNTNLLLDLLAVGDPCFVTENLSIGSIGAAYNLSSLQSYRINHILCLSPIIRLKFPQHFTYLRVPIQDNSSTDLFLIFEECFRFIDEALETSQGRVLVHCFQGISRSAAILCAYLMTRHGLSLVSCLEMLRSARPIISPNPSFLTSLRILERHKQINSTAASPLEGTRDQSK
jgi:dual specificity protein phosphatase 1B